MERRNQDMERPTHDYAVSPVWWSSEASANRSPRITCSQPALGQCWLVALRSFELSGFRFSHACEECGLSEKRSRWYFLRCWPNFSACAVWCCLGAEASKVIASNQISAGGLSHLIAVL